MIWTTVSSWSCFCWLYRASPSLAAKNIINLISVLLLSHFSCVRLCATSETAAHQAPPSLGFSRQEHWSGLPFPSPMHESEKRKWSHSVMSDFATPWTAAHQAPPPMGFSRRECWSGAPSPPLDIGVDHLVMPICTVVSCGFGRGCLLWPLHSLSKTLLAFALLHFLFQGQTCLLLLGSLGFLLLHSTPLWWKRHQFWC